MASADSCQFSAASWLRLQVFFLHIRQVSPDKNAIFPPAPAQVYGCSSWQLWVLSCLGDSSGCNRLKLDSCTSGRAFASGFLQIPPGDGHPCPWLTVGACQPPLVAFTLEMTPMLGVLKKRSSLKQGKPASSFDFFGALQLNSRIIPVIGKQKLQQIKPLTINRFYNGLLEKYSPDYVRHIHAILRKAFRQAVKWEMIASNPLDKVEAPKLRRKEMKTWSMEQCLHFLDTAEGYVLIWIVTPTCFLICSGMLLI